MGKMKIARFELLCIILAIFFSSTLITSAVPYSTTVNQESLITLTNNQLGTTDIDLKIATIMDMINEDMLREYLETLVGYGPRMTGTYGCEKSAEYIYQQFAEMGLQTRYQNWTDFGNKFHRGLYKSQNVEGTLKGTNLTDEKIIVFNAHYDTVRISPGGDDDGSGSAAVLVAAYVLSQFSFNHTIKFVTFSGEEVGLLGSHAYAKEAYENNDNIVVELNADMISYTETPEGGRKCRIYGTQDVEWVLDDIETINTDYGIDFTFIRSILNEDASRGGSDYFSFVEYGYETVAFFEAEWNRNMHSLKDNLNNVNFSYLVNTTRLIVGTIAHLADLEITDPQVYIESPRRGKLYLEGVEKRDIKDLKTIVVKDIWIWADVKYASEQIDRAEFYYDDRLAYTDTEYPFKWHFDRLSVRTHRITVIIYDKLGRNSSYWQDIHFINIFKNR